MKNLKTLTFTALSVMATDALAHMHNTPKSISKFGVGLFGGYVNDRVKGEVGSVSERKSGNSASIGIFMGYDHGVSSNFTVGPEIFAQYQDVKARSDSGITSHMKESYGALLKLSYVSVNRKFNPFLKGGYVNTKFNYSYPGASDRNEHTGGVLGGVGFDYSLAPRTSMGVEYTYTYYSDDTKFANGAVLKFKHDVNAVNLRIKYIF